MLKFICCESGLNSAGKAPSADTRNSVLKGSRDKTKIELSSCAKILLPSRLNRRRSTSILKGGVSCTTALLLREPQLSPPD